MVEAFGRLKLEGSSTFNGSGVNSVIVCLGDKATL